MGSLRSEETSAAFKAEREKGLLRNGCPLCFDAPIETFTFWRIIPNNFPYDRIAKENHMLVPKRHVTEDELTQEELDELKSIKRGYVNDNYNFYLESSHKVKSIPEHFHLHVITLKDEFAGVSAT